MTKKEIKAVICNIMADYGFIEVEHFKESMFGPVCLYCTARYYYDADHDDRCIEFNRFFCVSDNKAVLFDPLHVSFLVESQAIKQVLIGEIEKYEEQAKMALRKIEKTLRSQFVEVVHDEEFNW